MGVHGRRQGFPRAAAPLAVPTGGRISCTSMGRKPRSRRSTVKGHTALHTVEPQGDDVPHGGEELGVPRAVPRWRIIILDLGARSSLIDKFTPLQLDVFHSLWNLPNPQESNGLEDVIKDRKPKKREEAPNFLPERG